MCGGGGGGGGQHSISYPVQSFWDQPISSKIILFPVDHYRSYPVQYFLEEFVAL